MLRLRLRRVNSALIKTDTQFLHHDRGHKTVHVSIFYGVLCKLRRLGIVAYFSVMYRVSQKEGEQVWKRIAHQQIINCWIEKKNVNLVFDTLFAKIG